MNTNPDADDATWQLTPGIGDASNFTLVSQTKNGALKGFVLSLARSETNPCVVDGSELKVGAAATLRDGSTIVMGEVGLRFEQRVRA